MWSCLLGPRDDCRCLSVLCVHFDSSSQVLPNGTSSILPQVGFVGLWVMPSRAQDGRLGIPSPLCPFSLLPLPPPVNLRAFVPLTPLFSAVGPVGKLFLSFPFSPQ